MTKEETIEYKDKIITYPEMNFAKKLFNFINPFNTPIYYHSWKLESFFIKLFTSLSFGIALGSVLAGAPLLPQTVSYALSSTNFAGRAFISSLSSITLGMMVGNVFDAVTEHINYGTNILYSLRSDSLLQTKVEIDNPKTKLGSMVGCAIAVGGLMVGVPLLAPIISNSMTYLGFSPITSYFGRAVASTAACTIVGNTIGKAADVAYCSNHTHFTSKDYWRFRAYTLKDVKIVDIPPRS